MEMIGNNHDMCLQEIKKKIEVELIVIQEKKEKLDSLKEKVNTSKESFNKLITTQGNYKNLLKACHPGFIIGIDNLDFHIERKNMTLNAQNQDFHWVNNFIVENRVSGNELPNKEPKADLQDVPNIAFFPSADDHIRQRWNYIVLVSKIIVDYFTYFSCLKDSCIRHMPHKYTTQMSQQSKKV